LIEALALPFMQRALAAGIIVGLVASLLGIFVVLHRAAFFGDAIAHASLAGVALGAVTGAPPIALAAVVGVGIGLSLNRFERRGKLALDSILGFVLPFFMALGILVMSFSPGYQPELLSYLFGSILAVDRWSLLAIAAFSVVALVWLVRIRRPLVFTTFDRDGARVAGVHVDRLLTTFHVLLALVVIASIKIVGIILVNALLVIPAATAKLLARSLTQMFVLAPVIGIASVVAGLAASYWLDLPSGPAIVAVAGLIFIAAWISTRGR
jgi:zinc transport system permease protein